MTHEPSSGDAIKRWEQVEGDVHLLDLIHRQVVRALAEAAYRCDGNCGLSERECFDAHPVTWSGMVGGTTHVDGSTEAISAIAVKAISQVLTREDGQHVYLSTSCLHDLHAYCQSHTGSVGMRVPAQCKFCEAPCVCSCHRASNNHSDHRQPTIPN